MKKDYELVLNRAFDLKEMKLINNSELEEIRFFEKSIILLKILRSLNIINTNIEECIRKVYRCIYILTLDKYIGTISKINSKYKTYVEINDNTNNNYLKIIQLMISELHFKIQLTEYFLESAYFRNGIMPYEIGSLQISTTKYKGIFYSRDSFNNHMNLSGIYIIYNDEGVQYVGRSTKCVLKRSFQSVYERKIYNFTKIEYLVTESEIDTYIYEPYLISKLKPKLNLEFISEDHTDLVLPRLNQTLTISIDDLTIKSTEEKSYYDTKMNISQLIKHWSNGEAVINCKPYSDSVTSDIVPKGTLLEYPNFNNIGNYSDTFIISYPEDFTK